MKYVEIVAEEGSTQMIVGVADLVKARDLRIGATGEDGMRQMRMLVADSKLQQTLDSLQNLLGAQCTATVTVLEVEAVLPKEEEDKRKPEKSATSAREALYDDISKNALFDSNYIILVILSTIVAAVGLITDNTAVVIGAMVIAPFLGPNIALSFSTALGDTSLMKKAAKTLLGGLILSVALSVVIGLLVCCDITGRELVSRTVAGIDTVVLALAAGAAAALSISTGVSSALVGVMVAVALLPPATTLGIMLGHNRLDLAYGAGLLLAINIVCINLATKIVFVLKGIRPRVWLEKEKAKKAMTVYIVGWLLTLSVLMALLYFRGTIVG